VEPGGYHARSAVAEVSSEILDTQAGAALWERTTAWADSAPPS
jgi:hypothetical protein